MRNVAISLGIACVVISSASANITPVTLRTEYLVNPMAVDSDSPRLFWKVTSKERNQRQSAYQIRVANSVQALQAGNANLWDTNKVKSSETAQIEYAGKKLQSAQTAFWQVRVWDQDGNVSGWSAPAQWTKGLTATDWKGGWLAAKTTKVTAAPTGLGGAKWIWYAPEAASPKAGVRTFRKTFDLPADVAMSGSLLAAGDNSYTISVNGKVVSTGAGWTTIQSADISSALKVGPNVISVDVKNEGDDPAGFVAKVQIKAGTDTTIVTDASWQGAASANGTYTAAAVLGDYGMAPWSSATVAVAMPMDPPTYFRKDFNVDRSKASVVKATLYATAFGSYLFSINGKAVSNDALSPGWTEFTKRVHYLAYDVTGHLKAGDNAIGGILGDGWYASYLAFTGRRKYYGGDPALRAQLRIEYSDGRVQMVATDGTWMSGTGPVEYADMLMGTSIDYNKDLGAWTLPGFNTAGWKPAELTKVPDVPVQAHPNSGVREQELIAAKSRTNPKPGVFIYNIGQNLSGVVRFKVNGKKGQKITVRHGEFLNTDGTLYTTNLRAAKATDTYTLAKDGETICEPVFTFHGFQYVEITGVDDAPAAKDVKAVVYYSDLPKTGEFTSDNPLLNRLALNTDWGQRGNYLDVPTDCPQRDERAGWTGDAQVFTKAAAFNRDIAPFYTKWLVDLVQDSQNDAGMFGDVAPHLSMVGFGNAAWEDAGVVCTYRMWEMYGDVTAVKRHWANLNKFMDHLDKVAPNGIRQVGAYGDWLLLDGVQQSGIHGTAYYYQDAKMMAELAEAIGDRAAVRRYRNTMETARKAFLENFVTADGRVEDKGKSSQTFYALALAYELLPVELRAKATNNLVNLLKKRGDHLATGFIGTPVLLPSLRMGGRANYADQLFLTETFPSLLYQVKLGSTTMWERWDGWTPEKGFQDAGMNSFNHYWLGCITEYLHTAVGGIDTIGPGWKRIVVKPEVESALKNVNSTYDSIRGVVKSSWTRSDDGSLSLTVTIPANATAEIHVPAGADDVVTESGMPVRGYQKGDRRIVEVGSGTYFFVVRAAGIAAK